MDIDFYLAKFQKEADKLNKQVLVEKQIVVNVGLYKEGSVFLKLYKRTWSNNFHAPQNSRSTIFFSIWINDLAIKEQKLLYNIHAFKLRLLNGYSITSRAFAENFRKRFRVYEHQWPNVSVKFGPLTLMEGWIKLNADHLYDDILNLARQFLQIDFLIDDTLQDFK